MSEHRKCKDVCPSCPAHFFEDPQLLIIYFNFPLLKENMKDDRKLIQTSEDSLNLPSIPCRDCDEHAREGHGWLSGFTINGN